MTNSNSTSTQQPKLLYLLSATETWERFGFYGMRALLVLFMTKELMYHQVRSNSIYAAYAALIYFGPFIGGIIADRYLGYQKSVIFGGIMMALGYLLMIPNEEFTVYIALALVILGNGFFKSSLASTVGGLYEQGDPRRDAGFTIYYIGINIGASVAPIICSFVKEAYGTKYAFVIAFIGMLIALFLFFGQLKQLGNNGLPPDIEKLKQKIMGIPLEFLIYALSLLAVPVFISFLYFEYEYRLATYSLVPIGLMCFGYIFYTALKSDQKQREQLFVVLILMFCNTLFFSFFDLAATALTVFADNNVNRTVFGFSIPAQAFIAVNPTFTMILGVFFSQLWVYLAKRNQDPSTPAKFVFALVLVGIGFACFVLGTKNLDSQNLVPVGFLLLGYLFHTLGELCLSPVGLSTMTKLSPKTITAMVIGAWYLCWSFSNLIAKELANLTVIDANIPPVDSAVSYANVFGNIAMVSVAAGLMLIGLVPLIKKWMHGVN